ncbi:MAG: ABC transporter permease, partial [Lachnospiraceae bacterium]|nr:ABC transporter permease [Lachnospiraceae bacterium]
MIRYLFTKIKNKYKLYLCLICGMVSMIMVFSLIQMFRNGSLNKVIQWNFIVQHDDTGAFPATLQGAFDLKAVDFREAAKEGKNAGAFLEEKIGDYEKKINKKAALPVVTSQRKVYFLNVKAEFSYRDGKVLDVGMMDDGLDENAQKSHYKLEGGAWFYDDISEFTKDGALVPKDAYPVLISRSTADAYDLVVGEVVSFPMLGRTQDDERPDLPVLYVYISGIVSEAPGDYYWHKSLSTGDPMLILSKEDFYKIADEYTREVKCECYESLDYRFIDTKNLNRVHNGLLSLKKNDKEFSEDISKVIEKIKVESRSVEQMLYVIILPLAALILTFIGMISFRIIESETRELQTLKDRGLGKWRLIETYFLSSLVLSQISMPIGLVGGYFFGKVMAGINDFMGFMGLGTSSVDEYVFVPSMIVAGEIAALVSVLINLLPVFLFFKKKKDSRRVAIVPFWEKYFLDIVLLGISVYLLFNYKKQLPSLSLSVMNGGGIDPMIFVNATLFLFACGLLMLRLIFYLIRLFYRIGEAHFNAPTFAGLLQIIRTRKTSGVISVFMVVTVAMSLFHANMARTINSNKQARINYQVGTDVRIREKWEVFIKKVGVSDAGVTIYTWKYKEPDFGMYTSLVSEGLAKSVTKVAIDDTVSVTKSGVSVENVNMMGIHTKEFGNTAELREGLNSKHFNEYLNALASEYEGAIISSNLAKELKAEVGDYVQCDAFPPKVTFMKKEAYATTRFKVVAIVDAWPGFDRYTYRRSEEGDVIEEENHLMVVNYSNVLASFEVFPYEV